MPANPNVRPSRLALIVTTLAMLVLSACGQDAPTESSAAFNDADVKFLQSMIPHHAQAVEMAEMVADRTAHPDELGELADTIIATQQDEIDTMNALLADAGEEPVDPGAGHAMADMDGMAGMMDPADMEELASLDGEAFDLRFIEMMTAHHQGAIQQAQDVLGSGENAEVADLAQEIIAAQQAEIAQMQDWQQEWST